MVKRDFKDKFQSEWIGFYFECIFYDYLLKNKIFNKIFKFLNVKNNSDVFDLWILDSYYDDLKTHSLNSSAILGNDKETILNTIKKYDKIWLITLRNFTLVG